MQSRFMSIVEANMNLAVGFLLAWAVNVWVLPFLFGVQVNMRQGFGMTMLFSVLSFARQYLLRRFFNNREGKIRAVMLEDRLRKQQLFEYD